MNAQQVHQSLVQLSSSLREYAGADASRMTADLLTVLIASYSLDLMQVKPEGLVHLQAAIKQCAALRDVLTGTGKDIPKI